jgi:hypothetical protein
LVACVPRLLTWSLLAVVACGGKIADVSDDPTPVVAAPPGARPYDVTHSSVRFGLADRISARDRFFGGGKPAGAPPPAKSPGDWSYAVGGPINGGPAIFVTDQVGFTPSCTDMLYVPVNKTGTNVWAFTNLYDSCPNPSPMPSACSPSPAGHCPTVAWSTSVSGAMTRDSVALSLDGSVAYVATSSGRVYALNTAAGAARVKWQFDARNSDTHSTSTRFEGATPWVDYETGDVYAAAEYDNGRQARVYKLDPSGVLLAKTTIGDGVTSGVLVYDGFVYVGTTEGKLYKLSDGPTSLTPVGGAWPLQLTAETRFGPRAAPIRGTPSIDGSSDLLFVAVNNVMWSVKLTTGATHSVELGWHDDSEAQAGNFECYSSPFLYSDASTVPTLFIAHGKDQARSGDGTGPRLHRRTYHSDGTFDTDNLTSAVVGGSDLSYPRSSPLVFKPTPSSPVYVYVGDETGALNRFDYTTASAFTNHATFSAGSSIESPIVIDTTSGNLYFGANNGRVYQIGQASLR